KESLASLKTEESIRQLETDLFLQRFVTQCTNVNKLLNEHTQIKEDYVSPLHTDVCSQL
ncbi:rhoptry neck protein 5, partial [Hepatocystis sp. ex Piliocolobus tephrosceles]